MLISGSKRVLDRERDGYARTTAKRLIEKSGDAKRNKATLDAALRA